MIRVRQIKVPVLSDNEDFLIKKISNKLKIKSSDISSYKIIKKSIDARDKNNILFIYEVLVSTLFDDDILMRNKDKDVSFGEEYSYNFVPCGLKKCNDRVIIVGSGPCGLFCAYMLSLWGYRPIILERGDCIEERILKVNDFFDTNKLNLSSNIQFGEGGAGTFSDGKLNTLTKDSFNRGKKVFEIFVENGAPSEIMYENKPHIGTDILRKVIVNMRKKIISLGGEFHYNSCVTDLIINNGIINGVVVNNSIEYTSSCVVLAIGHSARDTFYMLNDNGVSMKNKNFAVGFRIEHPRKMIDNSQYGKYSSVLGAASYKLTHTCSNGRAVYSFCMCPGGFVVNASSEDGRLCINGMSNYSRDEVNSNSAIVVSIKADEFGDKLFSGLEFQRKIEENAYHEGNGVIPVQLLKDFYKNRCSDSFGDVKPNTKGGYSFGNLNNILSEELCSSIKEGISAFGRKIDGFSRDDALLLGVEARTSSPITIVRDEHFQSNIIGLYPCGEGAGYAGGITTAAIDGVKVAEEIARIYCI